MPLWSIICWLSLFTTVYSIFCLYYLLVEGGGRSTRQKQVMVFQLLIACWKPVFAEVNHSSNSLQFQDLKLAAAPLTLTKLLQIQSDIIKAKFGLKTVNLSNDEWILLCGYMAVNQGLPLLSRKQALMCFSNAYYQVEILKERAMSPPSSFPSIDLPLSTDRKQA